ncbi:MAG: FAD-dependent oxidoreductase [Cytophagales bacterium]|nr:FAD-dependent oxidoreductase [Cytophagales bacterium]
MSKKKTAIIGGGIAGLCSAYYLLKEGHQVLLLEKEEVAQACSKGNSGLIVPSHFVPLASPGVIANGLRWMLSSESPFFIKPRLDLRLLSWVWKFYRSANARHVEKSAEIIRDLNLSSYRLFEEIKKEGAPFEMGKRGLMMLFKEKQTREEEARVCEMANRLGIDARLLSASQVQDMEPDTELNVLGGAYYPGDAHVIPDEFNQALLKIIINKGAEVIEHACVEDFVTKNGRITKAILEDGREYMADEFVLAAGALSSSLARKLKINMPLMAGKGYSITMQKPEHMLRTPSLLCEAKAAVTPMNSALRIAGTMELSGQDLSVSKTRLRGLLKSVSDYLPQFSYEKLSQQLAWSGLRPCTPDGLPYIGRSEAVPNLIAATGHSMMGLSLGPVTGKLVSEIASEKSPSLCLEQLSPNRG